ncbi:MAG: Wadjet anti-phage system protein JetD domain-containing protein [Sphaerochaeta sp.]
MTSPQEVYKKLLTEWERGFFYKNHACCFPYEHKLSPISSKQMTEEFGSVDAWIRRFTGHAKLSVFLRYKEVNHRLLGRHSIPVSLLFETPEELATLLGKRSEWDTFISLTELLHKRDERLYSWAMRYPIRLLEVALDLDKLLLLWQWIVAHPRPGIYLRQIDLPGIDTKFTEKHMGLLSQWLDLTLEASMVDDRFRGITQFERRYGFLHKPELVRFRLLDPDLLFRGCDDISLPAKQFCELFQPGESLPIERVFVIENDICALTLPLAKKSLVIFGRGYYFDHLTQCAWLHRVPVWYWGDIDTHGFAILDQFRSLFPHTRSFLMDRYTLMEHKVSWGLEPKPFTGVLHHLEAQEADLYQELVSGRIQENLRLEQELVRYGRVESAIGSIVSKS